MTRAERVTSKDGREYTLLVVEDSGENGEAEIFIDSPHANGSDICSSSCEGFDEDKCNAETMMFYWSEVVRGWTDADVEEMWGVKFA